MDYRTRKVKCDEEKPYCLRCRASTRSCSYDNALEAPGPASILRTHSPLDLSLRENREEVALNYYFERVGPAIGGCFDVSFWQGIVLETCRSERAVFDAIIAISGLYEDGGRLNSTSMVSTATDLGPKQREALRWYCRSISQMRRQIKKNATDMYIALVTCILYICIEALQGHFEEALHLYDQGASLIAALPDREDASWNSSVLRDVIVPLFRRLGTFALVATRYPIQNSSAIIACTETALRTPDDYRTTIISLIAETMLLQREANRQTRAGEVVSRSPLFQSRQWDLQSKLQRWRVDFAILNEKDPSFARTAFAATLLSWHAAISVMISTCLTQHETEYDMHFDQFRSIVSWSKYILDLSATPDRSQSPFTFEMGVGMPLFFTTVKCRHPALRREALDLLRQAPSVEGFFNCSLWAALAEKILEIEDGRLSEVRKRVPLKGRHLSLPPREDELVMVAPEEWYPSTADRQQELIPENYRVHDYGTFRLASSCLPGDLSSDEAKTCLRFTRNRRSAKGEWYLEELFCMMS